MANVRYFLAVLLVVSIPPAVIWWFVIHPLVGFWRRLGVAASLTVNAVIMVAGCVGLWLVRGPLVGRDLGGHPAPVVGGVLCLAVSVWIALKRRRHLTFGILAGVPELEAGGRGGKVLSEGPYAVIRHPRYVEVAFGVLGYALLSNHTGAYVVALATIPLLHLVVLLEERELMERLGDAYREYAARVPRYVPKRPSRDPRP